MKQTITLSSHPGPLLYSQIRAGFVLNGTTFSQACRELGVDRENARRALFGLWNGPAAEHLRQRIYQAAGFREESA